MPETSSSLDVALISGPAYDPLYERLTIFERSAGTEVRVRFRGTHPELNSHLASLVDPPYDLVSTHTKYAPSQLRFLAPLDPFENQLGLTDFFDGVLKLASIGEQLFGIPRNLDVKLLHYRTDVLDAPPGTWDSLLEAAKRVAEAGSMHGFVFPGMESGLFGTFYELAEMGGARLFPDSLTPQINNPGGRWALELLRDLYSSGAAPHELVNWHYDEVHRWFRDGHAAMVCDWPGYYSSYTDPALSHVSGAFRVARMPAGPTGIHRAYGGAHTFALTKRGAARPEAVELLRFLTAPDQQRVEARHGSVPVRSSIMTELAAGADASESERLRLLQVVLDGDILVPPALPYYPEIEEVLWRTVQAAITGAVACGQALENLENRISDCHRRYSHGEPRSAARK